MALWELKHYQEIKLRYVRVCQHEITDTTVQGRLVWLFPANIPRDPEIVEKLFGISKEHKNFKHATRTANVDFLALDIGKDHCWIFSRHPNFVKYIDYIEILNTPIIAERKVLREEFHGRYGITSLYPRSTSSD